MLRIKELREEKGLTQKAVADAIKTNQSTVVRWENGEHLPSGEYVARLADLFQCSTDYILGRTDDFGNVNIDSDLDESEKKIIKAYKNADETVKTFISDAIDRIIDCYEAGKRSADDQKK